MNPSPLPISTPITRSLPARDWENLLYILRTSVLSQVGNDIANRLDIPSCDSTTIGGVVTHPSGRDFPTL